ncbi:MAG: hypothetical protein J5911_06280 [Clostridia bacterium]|nr:hypothetical protein [Clostridia bacterium]
MIGSYNIHIFVCKCDNCGRIERVEQDNIRAYNAAQAARSIGWSFGKDKKTYCPLCRKMRQQDNYR